MTNEEKAAKKAEEQAAKEAAEKAEESSPAKSRAEELFKQFPAAQEVHFTSDGFAFLSKCDATNHAKSLDVKKVETIKRKA